MQDIATYRIQSILNKRCLLACLGLALYWPMFRSPFLGTAFSSSPEVAFSPHYLQDILFLLIGCLALIFIAHAKRLSSWIGARPLSRLVFGLVATAGVILAFALSAIDASALLGMRVLGTVLFAIGFVGITAAWMNRLATLSMDQALVCLHVSFFASFLFGFFDFSNTILNTLCLAFPLGTAILSALVAREPVEQTEPSKQAKTADPTERILESRQLAIGMIAALFACLLACGVLRSLWISSAVTYAPSSAIWVTYTISSGISLIFLALLMLVPQKRKGLFIGIILLFMALLLAIALCSTLGFRAALSLTASVRTCSEFYLWCFIFVLGKESAHFEGCSFALFFALNSTSLLFTTHALPVLLGINPDTSDAFTTELSILSLLVVAIALIAAVLALAHYLETFWERGRTALLTVGGEEASEAAHGETPGAHSPEQHAHEHSKEHVIASLIEQHGLTEREAQVAEYLARGHSVKKASDTFHLAQSTVQGYTKTIYRKMGINSKQSLIDEIEALRDALEN